MHENRVKLGKEKKGLPKLKSKFFFSLHIPGVKRHLKRRKYDASFKEEVLKMVFNGRGVSLIYRWKSRYQGQHSVPARSEDIALTEEQLALHKRIKELEMERDILKKALGKQ